jgi:predicted nucleic acid-binding protein
MRLYLDVCCLKRPFDDQAQPRVRMETEAVLVLLAADPSRVVFVRSVAHDLENDQNPLAWRADRVRAWLEQRPLETPAGEALEARVAELMTGGLRGFDALHLACAEASGADIFVTCDDRLLAAAQRPGAQVKVRVGELTAVAREVLP